VTHKTLAATAAALFLSGASQTQESDFLAIRTVLVSVTDESGAHVPGLGVDDFEILERGVERDIEDAASSERETEITLAVDTSVGVLDQIQFLRRALEAFVRAVTPHNRLALYEFGGRASRLVEPTDDAATLLQAIKRLHTRRAEAAYLLDAIVETARKLEETEREEGNPAHVVIVTSDGPELSHNHYERAKEAGEASGAVYHVVLFESPRGSDDQFHQAEVEGALDYLTDRTGGTFERILLANAIENKLTGIAGELQPLYRVSFLTEVSPKSKLEELSVSVPNTNARAELIRLLPDEQKVPVSK
jgi:VWFA-related protein